MTLFLPGSAQLVAGNKKVGRTALRVCFVLLAVTAFVMLLSWIWPIVGIKLGTAGWFLGLLRLGLMGLAVGWAYLFMDAWRLGQPLTLVKNQRLAAAGLNGFLCFSVVGTLLFGAHLVRSGQVMLAIFPDGTASAPTHGRFNVLLLGGDSGAGRVGLRPDSMTIASIDEETGKTLLVGLPRNLTKFKFREGSVMDEQFPDGFDCEGCYLNAVSTWAGDNTELFGDSKNPGVDATIMAIEGITGLEINYWAMVNLAGFRELVDAVGGVTLNVRARIPIGLPSDPFYDHIEPGRKKLDGYHALWFARARDGSDDYSRMARQKCVMNALLTQVSPQTALRNFDKIAKAGDAMVDTNIPRGEVSTFIDLSLKAKSQKVATLSLVPPMINTGDPDLELILAKVRQAIDKAEGKGDKAEGKGGKPGAGKRKGGTQTGGSLGTRDGGYAANESDDLASAC